MTRRFVGQLGERESVDQVFLVSEKQLRANRNGNLYLQLRLTDKTGSLTGMMWNASEKIYGSFESGEFIQVQGTTQVYNGILQLIVTKLTRINADEIDRNDFVTLTSVQIDELVRRLGELLRQMNDVHLRNLAECFLLDEALMDQLTRAPAGIKNHHAYPGGLLEHVVNLMELAHLVGPRYEEINSDLLMIGAFLHDIGKIEELTYDQELSYSDEGQLLGHLIIGLRILEQKIGEAEKLSGESFPIELALRVKHMILSHHGEYEYGSPKLPMTPEAIALHFLDNLDSKIYSIGQLIREDVNSDSKWTAYQAALGRKIFKGSGN